MRRFLIDTDTASDDAVALVLALRAKDVEEVRMAVALDRQTLVESRRLFVDIETESVLSRGQTIVDHQCTTGKTPNVEVVMSVARARFLEILHSAIEE